MFANLDSVSTLMGHSVRSKKILIPVPAIMFANLDSVPTLMEHSARSKKILIPVPAVMFANLDSVSTFNGTQSVEWESLVHSRSYLSCASSGKRFALCLTTKVYNSSVGKVCINLDNFFVRKGLSIYLPVAKSGMGIGKNLRGSLR